MRFYKKISGFALGALCVGALLTTCSDEFLEVSPRGQLAPEVLATKAGVEGVVLGAYAQLGGRGNYFGGASNWANGSIQGGEANKGTEDGDFSAINDLVRYQLDPTSSIPAGRWSGLFEGVTRSNAALTLLAAAVDDPQLRAADAARLEAEARFLRAHYYFQLQISFDQAPFLTPGLTVEEQQLVVSTSNWDRIEEDFQFAFDNLPETSTQAGRANKWAAGAYLGKTYLFQGKWEEAKSMLQNVVDNGTTANGQKYGLLDNYASAFNAEFDNSKESVFAVQAAANSGTTNVANPDFVLNYPHSTGSSGPGNCCGFFQPTFDIANSFRTEDGLPLLDNSYNNESNRLKTDFGVEGGDAYTPGDEEVDPRLEHSVGRRGIPYLGWGNHPGKPWIRLQSNGGPYSPKKFVYYASQEGSLSDGTSWTRGYGSMNYNIIRFSDVLLMLAEAKIETNDIEGGRALINQVRARAAGEASQLKRQDDDGEDIDASNYSIALYDNLGNIDRARAALRFERKLELSGEGHRFFDLRRWGIAESELDRIIAFERQFLPGVYAGADFTTPQDLFYPIPQSQIDLQGPDILPQNPGYN